jgi:hypothetical protein
MKLCNINKFLYIFVLLILLTIFLRVLNNKKLVEKFSNIWRLNSSGQLCNNGQCKNIGLLNNNNQICNIDGVCLTANSSNTSSSNSGVSGGVGGGGGGGGAVGSGGGGGSGGSGGGGDVGGGSGGSGGGGDVGGEGVGGGGGGVGGEGGGGGGVGGGGGGGGDVGGGGVGGEGGGGGGGGGGVGVGGGGSSDNTITITSDSIYKKNSENKYVLSKTYHIDDIYNYFSEDDNYYVVDNDILYFDDINRSLKVTNINKINYNNPYGSDNIYGSDCNDEDDDTYGSDSKCPTIRQFYLLGISKDVIDKFLLAYEADSFNVFNSSQILPDDLLQLEPYRINIPNIEELNEQDLYDSEDNKLYILQIDLKSNRSVGKESILIEFKNSNIKIENLQILFKNPIKQGGIITTVNPTNA